MSAKPKILKPKATQAPSHLSESTRTWWDALTSEFMLEDHHLRLLTLAAEAWDRCQQAREILAREGLTFSDRYGSPRTRPEIAIERDSRLAFCRCLRELNLDVAPPPEVRIPRAGGRY